MSPESEKPTWRKPAKEVDQVRAFYERTDVLPYLLTLIDDFQKLIPPPFYSIADSHCDKETLIQRISTEGVSFALITLPLLAAGLFKYLEQSVVEYPGFKIKPGTGHPVFLQRLFRLAYSDGEHRVKAIECIYQFSVAFKKLKGPYSKTVLTSQLRKFIACDAEGASLDFESEVTKPIMDEARDQITAVFHGINLNSQHAKPRPGPGATNTPVAKHMRFRPHVLYRQIDDVIPYVDEFHVHPWDSVTSGWYNRLYRNRVDAQRARYRCVHKTVGKPRGICIEENEAQFLQQKYKRLMYWWVQKHPITKGRINFDDQSINASLALLSSATGEDATIDMSEASDRVFRKLVSLGFRDTELHDVLMALSTRWIDFPPEYLEEGMDASMMTEKYAPMGSGLCFPVMSLIHWALCRAIIKISMLPDSYMERVYVYGDDIILPSACIEAVFCYLPMFGMKINEEKSFYRSRFRESCGIHAYDGKNITPVYFKHLPTHNHREALSCFEVEYSLRKKGYTSTANLLKRSMRIEYGLLAEERVVLPYVPLGSKYFGFIRDGLALPVSVERTNRGFDSWGNPVQRHLVVSFNSFEETPPSEEECYLRRMLTSAHDRKLRERPEEFNLRWASSPVLNHVVPKARHVSDVLDIAGNTPRSARDIDKEKHYEHFNHINPRQKRGSHNHNFQWFSRIKDKGDTPGAAETQGTSTERWLRRRKGLCGERIHRPMYRVGEPCFQRSYTDRRQYRRWTLHPEFWVGYHLTCMVR